MKGPDLLNDLFGVVVRFREIMSLSSDIFPKCTTDSASQKQTNMCTGFSGEIYRRIANQTFMGRPF